MKAVYLGIFLDGSSADRLAREQRTSLDKLVNNMHCTFSFRPSDAEAEAFSRLVGKHVALSVTGYGADAENSGFLVDVPSDLQSFYHGSARPHITVSLSENGKAVNTGKLSFSSIDSFSVMGTCGIFSDSGKVLLSI